MRLLLDALPVPRDPRILTAFGNAEDAAVYRLDAERALILTVDVITPLIDDAYQFGSIAALNSLSDIFAMGGTGLLSLSILGVPADFPPEVAANILRGGGETAQAQGAPIVGGHSIQGRDVLFGLMALGMVHPEGVLRNDRLQAGDQLVLTKPLGTGTLTTARKFDGIDDRGLQPALIGMLTSNAAAVSLLHEAEVRATTDVTGFGLLGHAAEMAGASQLQIVIETMLIPEYPQARDMLAKEFVNRAHSTNITYAHSLGPVVGNVDLLLCDPQTSGGLLVAVRPDRLDELVQRLHAVGYPHATRIGEVRPGKGLCLL